MKGRFIIILIFILLFSFSIFAQTHPGTKEFYKNLELYKKKSYKKAYQGFKNFIKKYPYDHYLPEAWFYLAILETNYYSAIILYKELIKKYPEHRRTDEALYRLGKLYLLHNNYTEAARIFKKIINTYKKSNFFYGTHYYLGLIYLIKSDFQEAIEYFDYVIDKKKKDKFHILSIIGKGNCYFEIKDYNKSIYYFKIGVKIKNKNYFPSLFYGMANSYLKNKKYNEAYDFFRLVVKQFPGSSEYELALEKLNYIKNNKTIFELIDWTKYKKEERPKEIKPKKKYYYIRVASVKNKRYANDWRIKLKTSGYTSKIQTAKTDKGTFYRTLIGPYKKKKDAEKTKKDIERKFKLKGTIIEFK